MISERLNQFGRIVQGPDVQVTFRDLTGTTYVLPVKHIDYEVGFVRIQVGVIPKQMHDQDGLRKAAQMALDLLKENLIAFGPCDHDVGICNCDIEQCIDLLRKELGHG